MNYITVKLTEDQIGWLEFLIGERVVKLNQRPDQYNNSSLQQSFARRIKTALRKARVSNNS